MDDSRAVTRPEGAAVQKVLSIKTLEHLLELLDVRRQVRDGCRPVEWFAWSARAVVIDEKAHGYDVRGIGSVLLGAIFKSVRNEYESASLQRNVRAIYCV